MALQVMVVNTVPRSVVQAVSATSKVCALDKFLNEYFNLHIKAWITMNTRLNSAVTKLWITVPGASKLTNPESTNLLSKSTPSA